MLFLKYPNTGIGIFQNSHLTSTHTQFWFCETVIRNQNCEFGCEIQSYPTAFIEFAGREMICGGDLCSMQGPVHQRGVIGTGHSAFCVNIVNIYIYIYIYVFKTCVEQHKYALGNAGKNQFHN